MSKNLDEFVRQTIDVLLKELPPAKRLQGERLEGLSPEGLRAFRAAGQRLLQSPEASSKSQ
jgi:hypothetical protein